MSYKTILVHFADERRLPGLLGPAIALARRFESHLIGLAVLPPPIIEPSLTPGGGTTIIESHREAFAEEIERMKQVFEAATRSAGLVAEWVKDDANPWPVWRKVVDYGRAVDLIVAAQPDFFMAPSAWMEAPADLVLHSGRPVLFIPNGGDHVSLGKRILVAWNGRREASRAAFDALPLLKTAGEVKVLWISQEGDEQAEQEVPAADLCTGLARHKVRCEAAEGAALDSGVGETLMAHMRDWRADLLVMGCYGHSRFREFILGGATHHVLRTMTVPVLMAH